MKKIASIVAASERRLLFSKKFPLTIVATGPATPYKRVSRMKAKFDSK